MTLPDQLLAFLREGVKVVPTLLLSEAFVQFQHAPEHTLKYYADQAQEEFDRASLLNEEWAALLKDFGPNAPVQEVLDDAADEVDQLEIDRTIMVVTEGGIVTAVMANFPIPKDCRVVVQDHDEDGEDNPDYDRKETIREQLNYDWY